MGLVPVGIMAVLSICSPVVAGDELEMRFREREEAEEDG